VQALVFVFLFTAGHEIPIRWVIEGITMRSGSRVLEMPLGNSTLTVRATNGQLPPPATILVVEDEGFVREVTCKVLESAGYAVISTQNAAEAKRKFRHCATGVDLLRTDVVLPGPDGLVLANELRAICPALKTIFMSG
jgi:PleD family two-component response regulator